MMLRESGESRVNQPNAIPREWAAGAAPRRVSLRWL